MQGWVLSHNWDQEVLNTALIARVGPERTAQLGDYPPATLVLPVRPASLAELLASSTRPALAPGPALSGLSNNWVVDGAGLSPASPSGQRPSPGAGHSGLWYEGHLSAPGFG